VTKPSTAVLNRLPITKAHLNLGQLAKRAHLNKEYFILEKDGIPVIGIMDAEELEDYLELRDRESKPRSAKATRTSAPDAPGRPERCCTSWLPDLLNAHAAAPDERGFPGPHNQPF